MVLPPVSLAVSCVPVADTLMFWVVDGAKLTADRFAFTVAVTAVLRALSQPFVVCD